MSQKRRVVAYLRVSTLDQDLEKNKHDILKLANEKDLGKVEFIEEKISGTVSWKKRKLFDIIEQLQVDDVLIVSELSRLGRSMLECMEILSIASTKGVLLYAIKGNWQLDGSLQSKVMAMAFSIASEIERDLISSRTKEALRVKKQNGEKLGRPTGVGKSKLDEYRLEIEALLHNGTPKTIIAERYQTTRANLYNWLRQHEINQPSICIKVKEDYPTAIIPFMITTPTTKKFSQKEEEIIKKFEDEILAVYGYKKTERGKSHVCYDVSLMYKDTHEDLEKRVHQVRYQFRVFYTHKLNINFVL